MNYTTLSSKGWLLASLFLIITCGCEMDRELSAVPEISETNVTEDAEVLNDSSRLRMGNIIYEETFEGENPLTQFISRQLPGSHSFNVISTDALEGRKAGRFELRKGDRVVTTTGIRAQMLFQNRLVDQLQNEGWYSFALYLPANEFTPDDDEESITSWRHPSAGAYLSLRIHNDRFKFRIDNELIDLGPAIKDFWHQYVFHIKHSTGSNGFVEVWKNGEKVVSRSG